MKQKSQRRSKASDGAAPTKKPAPPIVLRATNRPAGAPVKNGTPTNRSPQVRFTQEIADEICARMAAGEALTQLCRDPRMPGTAAVYRWLEERPSFREAYIRARIALYDHWAEETIAIADDGSNDWIARETQAGRVVMEVDREHIARSRERIAARQWLTGKLRPGKYGNKLDLNVAGQPGGAPIQYEDIRDRNVALLDQVSARLAGATAGASAGEGTEGTAPIPESGAGT